MEMKTDAHTHSSELRGLDAEMLSVVPGEGGWWYHSLLGVHAASITAQGKTNTKLDLHFLSVFL